MSALIIGRLTCAAICFAGAVYLLANHAERGWGWLIFIGFMLSGMSLSFERKS